MSVDTDKYKGHTPAPWRYSNGTIWGGEGDNYISLALDLEGSYQPRDVVLMADAPLLLEEVMRLRAWKKLVSDIVQQHDGPHLREMLKEMIQ